MFALIARVVFSLTMVGVLALGAPTASAQDHPRVQDEIIVQFKENTAPQLISKINLQLGTRIVITLTPNQFLVKIPESYELNTVISQYIALPEVDFAEPNFVVGID